MTRQEWAVGSGQWAVDRVQGSEFGAADSCALHSSLPTAHRPPRTSHYPPPTAHCALLTSRRGISLLEVLAAIGVLTVGLLGLAALLPIGRYTISEAIKGDRAGDCGRAGLRDIVVRRMLDSYPANPNPPPPAVYAQWLKPSSDTDAAPSLGASSFILDPRGAANGLTGNFGGVVPRITLGVSPAVRASKRYYTKIEADNVFLWPDDLVVNMPEDMNTTPKLPVGRPVNVDSAGKQMALTNNGDFSWFVSVVPMPNNSTRFTVSIVVCYKRDFSERTATVAKFYDSGMAGGGILLNNPSVPFEVKENDWIALCGVSKTKPTLCRWYRVASMGDDGVSLTLIGPDWDTSYTTTAVALGQSVIGVYTTTIELDSDPTWKN